MHRGGGWLYGRFCGAALNRGGAADPANDQSYGFSGLGHASAGRSNDAWRDVLVLLFPFYYAGSCCVLVCVCIGCTHHLDVYCAFARIYFPRAFCAVVGVAVVAVVAVGCVVCVVCVGRDDALLASGHGLHGWWSNRMRQVIKVIVVS